MHAPLTPLAVGLIAMLPFAAAAETGTSAMPDHAMAASHGGLAHDAPAHDNPAGARHAAAMEEMMAAMEAVEPTGDPDADFLLMMIPHHEAAVAMAQALLEEGGDDPETRAMAQAVIDTQTAEIAAMRTRLDALGHAGH